ncbi:MAG: DUF1080 domain-containing protein [Gemmatimonadetes bacterium]|nr:DUF1080 domain-containing protein [Gemmatimonadota bacterium]
MKLIAAASIALLVAGCASVQGGGRSLFNGVSLEGWSRKAVHGGGGGLWSVENGTLVANQEPGHTGGLLGTDRSYADFEIELEFSADDPADTGLFLRTREDGMGYQITIDNHAKGTVGSLYAPTAGNFLVQYPDWRRTYRTEGWNHLRARITGQPARINAWLNGVQTLDFQDTIPRYPREGYIGLQVHGGAGSWGEASRARFRNIRITELD